VSHSVCLSSFLAKKIGLRIMGLYGGSLPERLDEGWAWGSSLLALAAGELAGTEVGGGGPVERQHRPGGHRSEPGRRVWVLLRILLK